MLETPPLERGYKGYTISGSANRVFGYDKKWYAASRVSLMCPDNVRIEVERFHDPLLAYEDQDLARLFGLFVAELAVDHWLPDPWYYIRPMDFAWAVDIIRLAAVECKEREIRRPKLYESLDFLEKQLDEKSTWLVRRYRRELRWDRRTYQEKEELREILRATTRGIQFACVKLIVRRLNELAIHFRENKSSIDNLRLQLAMVRRPVPL
jgi:hypothetical protein